MSEKAGQVTTNEHGACKRRGKFNNQPVEVDGFRFDSKKEAARWCVLRLMLAAGAISDLERQVSFPLVVGGMLVCNYVADFVYDETGKRVVEDVKSAHTRTLPVYRLKRKLMLAVHGIEIREV